MSKQITGIQWLSIVSPDKLAKFQRAFKEYYNIGIEILDKTGKPLIAREEVSGLDTGVPHNKPLYSSEEQAKGIKLVYGKITPVPFFCSTGVAYLLCPILWSECLVAFVQVGPFALKENKLPGKKLATHNLFVFTKREIEKMGSLLMETFHLLDMGKYIVDETSFLHKSILTDDALSDRERQVISVLCEGRTNKEIGAKLGISEKTVRTHIQNILNKQALDNKLQIILYYLKKRR